MKRYITILVPLLLLIFIAATRQHLHDINNSILLHYDIKTSPLLTDLAVVFAIVGNTTGMVVQTILAVAVLVLFKRRRDAFLLAIIMILGSSLNALLKNLFHDIRPDLFTSPYPAGGYSFPSGHAQAAVAFYGTLALFNRRWFVIVPCLLMILGIGWCRVYLGVHRPTDVAAGYCLACFVIALVTAIAARRPRSGGPKGSACTNSAACL